MLFINYVLLLLLFAALIFFILHRTIYRVVRLRCEQKDFTCNIRFFLQFPVLLYILGQKLKNTKLFRIKN